MNLLKTIRERLLARIATPTLSYWDSVLRIARGEIGERQLPKLLDQIEAQAVALERNVDDVSADVELAQQFVAADAAAGAMESAQAEFLAVRSRADADRSRAAALEVEAKELRRQADQAQHRAHAGVEGARAARSERHRCLRELRDRGYPAAADEIGTQLESDLVADLQKRIDVVDQELVELRARQATAGKPFGDNIEEDPHALDAHIDRLEKRRAALTRCLSEKRQPTGAELA